MNIYRLRCLVADKLKGLCTDPEEIDWSVVRYSCILDTIKNELEVMSYEDYNKDEVQKLCTLYYEYLYFFYKYKDMEREISKVCKQDQENDTYA